MAHINQGQRFGEPLDVSVKFHYISNKLKKRFLRKPNVTEASDQFNALANECEQKELWQYAGLSSLAAAKCQGTLENASAESSYLIKAGREFLTAEKKDLDIGCPSVGQENTQAAVSCYGHALIRYGGQPGFATVSADLALELALALGPISAGIQQLKKSIQVFPTAKAITTLVSYHIKQGDYISALHLLTQLADFVEAFVTAGARGKYTEILHKSEVTRILLLLILQPSPQRLPPSLTQLLEKYAWIEDSSPSNGLNMPEDEQLLLQSLVLACQSHDYQALLDLEGELWPYFDTEEKELFHKLIQVLTHE